MRGFLRRGGSREPVDETDASGAGGAPPAGDGSPADSATVTLPRASAAPPAPFAEDTTRSVPVLPAASTAGRGAPALSADTEVLGIGAAPASAGHTEVLGVSRAGAAADPGAATQVIGRVPVVGPSAGRPGADSPPGSAAPAPLVSRRVAAEIGLYCGAALALVAILGVLVRGWSSWDSTLHAAFVALSTVTLVAAGLFLRLPWRRAVGGERRRAVSGLLTTGVGVASIGVSVALRAGEGPAEVAADAAGSGPGSLALAALGAVLGMLAVNVVARSPLAETGLLIAAAWAAWVVAPPGPGTWAFLAGLAAAWAALGYRWARGRRTAVLLGASVALLCSVGMATGPWAWPTRAGLAGIAAVGLGFFLRGRANAWLALGAGAATALAASVAGDVVGPALALLVGGVATMVVSGIALLGASPRGASGQPRPERGGPAAS